jgi:hypothetical protein
MTLTEIINTFKNKLDPSILIHSIENMTGFYNRSDKDTELNV